jgi:hypothetical protein
MTILKAAEIFATVNRDIHEIASHVYNDLDHIKVELYDMINRPNRSERIASISIYNSISNVDFSYFYDLNNIFSKNSTHRFIIESNFKKLKLLSYEVPQSASRTVIGHNIDITFPIDLIKSMPSKLVDSGLLLENIDNPSEGRLILMNESFLEEDLEFFKIFNPELFGNLELNKLNFNHNYSTSISKYKLGH